MLFCGNDLSKEDADIDNFFFKKFNRKIIVRHQAYFYT
jgi:hypothetical protein